MSRSVSNRIIFAAIGGMVAAVTVLEFWVVYYSGPIDDFVHFSPYVFGLQIILLCFGTFGSVVVARNNRWGWVIACLLIIYLLIILITWSIM